MSDIDDMIDRLTERQRSEFALKCARRVERLMRDPRSVAALDTRERWLRGEATDEELQAARVNALDAEYEAQDSSWAAARVAAQVADARKVAMYAASAVAREARDSYWDAAWAAERAWQREELERMLKEGGWACGG